MRHAAPLLTLGPDVPPEGTPCDDGPSDSIAHRPGSAFFPGVGLPRRVAISDWCR